jgi:hypothetical protein
MTNKKESDFIPKDGQTYYCTKDIGLGAYLVNSQQELCGMDVDENGTALFFIDSSGGIEDLISNYRDGLSPEERWDYLSGIDFFSPIPKK